MKLRVPATTTNFGSGFDTFGLALNLYNTFEVEKADAFGVEAEGEGEDLPRDERNLVIKVYKRCCEIDGFEVKPFRLKQEVNVPTARGLGSSATAIVAGIEIFSILHGSDLPLEEKLKIAFEFEMHPDNLLPAFIGGFVICADGVFKKIEFPKDLSLVFAIPDYKISTEESRGVLPKELSLHDAVFNIQRASLFVVAITMGDYSLLREAVEDRIHQRYRSKLIKGYDELVKAGYSAGALAVYISGSGPTIGAIVEKEASRGVAESFANIIDTIGGKVLTLEASQEGVSWL